MLPARRFRRARDSTDPIGASIGGPSAGVSVTVELSSSDLISSLEAPDLFSPDGDDRRDTAALRFNLLREVTLTVDVVNDGGTTVRNLTTDELTATGRAILSWDGTPKAPTVCGRRPRTSRVTAR